MKLGIYVEVSPNYYERLDMFEDESVQLNIKLKDLNDIGKAFSTFSQTFSIPTSDNNKIYLQHFFNPDVKQINGRKINAKIVLNGSVFKVGYILLQSKKVDSYSVQFFTGAATLKDRVGDDLLSSLAEDYPLLFKWDDATVYNYLSNPILGGPYLISNSRVWTYGDDGPNDIAFRASGSTSATTVVANQHVKKEDLRPTVRFKYIVDSINDKYDLNMDVNILNENNLNPTIYDNLVVYCNAKNSGISPTYFLPIQNQFPAPNGAYAQIAITGNTVTSEFNIRKVTPSNSGTLKSSFFEITLTPKMIFDSVENAVTFDYIDTRPATSGQVLFSETINVNKDNLNIKSSFNVGSIERYNINVAPLTFKVRMKQTVPFIWDNCTYQLVSRVRSGLFSNLKITLASNDNTSATLDIDNLNLLTLLPSMKIIDFLDSFFKTFNLRVREDYSTNKIFIESPNFYGESEVDYTPYVNVEDVSIETQQVYKTYLLTHNTPKYNSSVAYATANKDNPNSKEYGQLIANTSDYLSYGNGEYSVKTKFNLMVPVMIPGVWYSTYYGFDDSTPDFNEVDSSLTYQPNYDELTIFYAMTYDYIYTSEYKDLAFVNEKAIFGYKYGNEVRRIDRVVFIGNATNMESVDDYYCSLGFKDEVNPYYPTTIYQNNLYTEFYKKAIETLNNPYQYYYTFECYLPMNEIRVFDIRNNILIGNNKYSVEEANIDLTTGKTKLKLVNIKENINLTNVG